MVSNTFARDMRLKARTRGVALWIFSHAAGFTITPATIAKANGLGRDVVRSILAELEQFGYLRRRRTQAEDGRFSGMDYEIRCTPFEDESPGQIHEPENQALDNQALAEPHHKKNTSKKTIQKKINPPGGAPRSTSPEGLSLDDPAPATHEEESMPRRSPEPQLGLFEAERPAAAPKPPGAHTVAAAYVDAFRAHFSAEPTKGTIGRVARLAKEMLAAGTEVALLVEAATLLGATPYAALDVQVNKMRRPQQSGSRAMVPAVPHDADVWAEMAAESDRRDAAAAQDPRWLAYQQGLASEGVAS